MTGERLLFWLVVALAALYALLVAAAAGPAGALL